MPNLASPQVSWWSLHEHIAPLLNRVGDWPTVGTPQWCELDDGDPRKLAAIFDAAQHHALRLELNQEAHAQASRDIAAAVDWPALAREINQRTDFYAARPWLKRVS